MSHSLIALLFLFALSWRPASVSELREIIPARASVEKEHIETEFRTASAITDGQGQYVAGVVLITAGYSAEGKYSHFFLTQVPLAIGSLSLPPGKYVFGWQHQEDWLAVKFYAAETGKLLGTVEATRTSRTGRLASFHIDPPADGSLIRVGRFALHYKLTTHRP